MISFSKKVNSETNKVDQTVIRVDIDFDNSLTHCLLPTYETKTAEDGSLRPCMTNDGMKTIMQRVVDRFNALSFSVMNGSKTGPCVVNRTGKVILTRGKLLEAQKHYNLKLDQGDYAEA